MAERVRHGQSGSVSGMPMRVQGEKSSLRHGHAQLNVELWYFDHNSSYRAPNKAWFDARKTLRSPLQLSYFEVE